MSTLGIIEIIIEGFTPGLVKFIKISSIKNMVKTTCLPVGKVTILGKTISTKALITGIVATTVGLGILGTGGAYYYNKARDNKTEESGEVVQEEKVEEIVVETEEIKTKECKSEKLGIKVDVPEDWICDEKNEFERLEIKGNSITVTLTKIPIGAAQCSDFRSEVFLRGENAKLVKSFCGENVNGYMIYPNSFSDGEEEDQPVDDGNFYGNISFLISSQQTLNEKEQAEIKVILDSIEIIIEFSNKGINEVETNISECKNTELGIKFDLPVGWNCKQEKVRYPEFEEGYPVEFYDKVTIKSDFFTLIFHNYSFTEYPSYDDQYDIYDKNNVYIIRMTRPQPAWDSVILGYIKEDGKIINGFKLEYPDYKESDLSESKMNQLIEFLNSFESI